MTVDEGWLYLAKDRIKATLIEDVDALTRPKVHRKPHIDLSLRDLGLFSSLRRQASEACARCADRDQTTQSAVRAFNDYPSDKLEDMWASCCNNMRSIMEALGGDDYKRARDGGKERRRDVGASVDLSIDLSDYDRRVELISE